MRRLKSGPAQVKKADTHKYNLVRTAMRLFRRQGYASTGLQQILDESGAPKGSLYYYFPNGKEQLAEAAVEMAGGLIREMLEGHARRNKDPKRFLRAYCRTMAGWMEESKYRSGCPIATTLLENAPDSPAITESGREAINGWTQVIAGVFERAGKSRREAREKAQLIVCAMEGALILARVGQSSKPILDVAKLAS